MIKLSNIRKAFDEKTVLDGFSLSVQDREHIAIMGESGCGKTTLLRIIAGLDTPDSGFVEGYRFEDVGYTFQESRLFESLTVLDNIACVSDKPMREARKDAMYWVNAVGLADSADLYPSELSGGMAQRVSIARMLMANKEILLMDEAFSALDEDTKKGIIALIKEHSQLKTLILVTHSKTDAEQMSTRIVTMG